MSAVGEGQTLYEAVLDSAQSHGDENKATWEVQDLQQAFGLALIYVATGPDGLRKLARQLRAQGLLDHTDLRPFEESLHVHNRLEIGDHSCAQATPVTCGKCEHSWCDTCDPGPSALCHWCHGRGYSTADLTGSVK